MRLSVRDFGKGLPVDFDAATTGGLGLKLIRSLGGQLGGRATWRSGDPGTVYELDFDPVPATATTNLEQPR